MVLAFIAVLLALGGASYAAVKLPARSVGTRELKRNAVNGSKVVNNSLTGSDVREASLAGVASALTANSAANSDHAGAAAGLDRVTYRGAAASVPPAPDTTTSATASGTASCDVGQVVVGGGVKVDDTENTSMIDSYPDGARAWTARVDNGDNTSAHGFAVYAICIPAGTVG